MSLWKDKASGTYKFKFQVKGKVHGGGGFKTRAEARTAREEKRSKIISGSDSLVSPSPKTPLTFLEIANAYLLASQRRHTGKTFQYKQFVYRNFLKHAGGGGDGLRIVEITPFMIQNYLQTRATNSNYNRHRKELGALFEYARRILGIVQVNPCAVLEKLPEEKKLKVIPTQEEFFRMITGAGPEERPRSLFWRIQRPELMKSCD